MITVIADSDGIIGSLNVNDVHYREAQQVLLKLVSLKAKLIYPTTVISETVTLLQGRLNQPELAQQIIQQILENRLSIASVDNKILEQAASRLDLKSSKHNTLFDCIVAAIAEDQDADAIFSFDSFYKRNGFKLASELK